METRIINFGENRPNRKNVMKSVLFVLAKLAYNDIGMLKQANEGILFDPPENVISDYPQFSVSMSYADFQKKLEACKIKLEK